MCSLCNWFKNNINPPVKTVLTASEVWKDFDRFPNTGPEDEYFHCADIEQVMDWLYECRNECPLYTGNTISSQGFDCDDFAKCFAAFCRRKNLTNAVWEVWGTYKGVSHAWNVVQCPDCKYEIEPQTGEVSVWRSNPHYEAVLIK